MFNALIQRLRPKANQPAGADSSPPSVQPEWPTVSIVAHPPGGALVDPAWCDRLRKRTVYPAWDLHLADPLTHQPVSARLNAAARQTRGDLLVFLDARMEPKQSDWLLEWVRFTRASGWGATGPLVLYPEGNLKDAGLHLGVETVAGPSHRHAPPDQDHVAGHPGQPRHVTAISAQALMIPREHFERLGGFDEAYWLAFHDVDLGLRLRAAGLTCGITPLVQVVQDISCFYEEPLHHADAAQLMARLHRYGLDRDPWLDPEADLFSQPMKKRSAGGASLADALFARMEQIRGATQPGRMLDPYTDDCLGLFAPASPDSTGDRWAQADELLDHLRREPELRARFPRALSGGPQGDFARWLESPEGTATRRRWAGGRELLDVAGIFALHPAHRLRRIYLWRQDLRRFFPLALLPEGRERWLRWLIEHGRADYGLRPVEIRWFLMETAESPARELAYSWLHTPEWQERMPDALAPANYPSFLAWMQFSFGLDPARYLPAERPAPVPPPDDPGAPGVNLLGHLMLPCGLQYSAVSALRVLQNQGYACAARDIPGRELDEPPGREDFLATERHDLSLIFLAPLVNLHHWYTRAGLAPRAGVRRIGYWYWEFPEIPEAWSTNARGYEEIWAPTRFIRDSLSRALPLPVVDMLPCVEVQPAASTRREFGLPEEGFLFLFMFDFCSVMERKNPLGLIRAFRRAFAPDEPVHLAIKTIRGTEFPDQFARLQEEASAAGVRVMDRITTRAKAIGLMTLCDAYASLHRSEGFGLTMAEAMLLGKPVVATGYSGNLDFMTPDNSRLVRYSLGKTAEMYPPYEAGWTWAEPDLDDAAAHLRWVYDHPTEAATMARRGQAEARELLGPESFGRRMATRLEVVRKSRV